MYRDPPARTTLTFEGRAHFETDPAIRDRVFDLAPEQRLPAAMQLLGIDLTRLSDEVGHA